MKQLFSTQVYENYNHTGEGAPYWKAKGGSEYVVRRTDGSLTTDQIVALLTINNPCIQETVIAVEEVADDYVPQFERDQMEYEGVVQHYDPKLTVRRGKLYLWKKFFGYDRKMYAWCYEMTPAHALRCIYKNRNAAQTI